MKNIFTIYFTKTTLRIILKKRSRGSCKDIFQGYQIVKLPSIYTLFCITFILKIIIPNYRTKFFDHFYQYNMIKPFKAIPIYILEGNFIIKSFM